MMLLTCVLVLVAGALSGCHEDEVEENGQSGSPRSVPGAIVLEYRIVDDTVEKEPRGAEPGRHCGDASIDDDTLTIGLRPDEEVPEDPWLAIFPRLPAQWHTSIAEEPFKTPFPATVDPNVQDDNTTLGDLDRVEDDENRLLLDGKAVPLPHSWTVEANDGSWHAEATVSWWTGEIETERYSGLCD